MNPETHATPQGGLSPAVIAGCFDNRQNCMWLAFEDQSARYYPKVSRTILKKLMEFEGPGDAMEYLQEKVFGKIESKPIDFHSFQMAQLLGFAPPTD